jgi:two-component system sensor histidine kinase BaeS
MAVKLRTRLFLVVGALLAASIAVSALLSRRATLVEVRQIEHQGPASPDAAGILTRAAAAAATETGTRLSRALASIEAETGRPLLAADDAGAVIAVSSPRLASALVKELTADGAFTAVLGSAGAQSTLTLRGAPTRAVMGPDGRNVRIVALPGLEDGVRPHVPRTPLWVWTTLATAVVGVPLVFAVARRILRPVSALTAAAHQMQSGRLDVRVDVDGRDELAELARAFNAMAARLAENERLRRQMVSDIAHELRSPVTNLRCALESMQDGLVAADRASIDALHDETVFLQRLIADLQELTLADAGQLTLHAQPVDLADVVRRAAAATSGDGRVELGLPHDLPRVTGDPDRLEQVFRNLLSNARTHTRNGGRIDIRARHDGSFVSVDVVDTGSGIAAAHVAHVFDRFYRADGARSRTTGGAGLGLAIVRHLVIAHGGTVSAASDGLGHGATFTVRLPARHS